MFETKDLVLINRVDMCGYRGRGYHPNREDEGLVAEVVKVLREEIVPEDGQDPADLHVLKCLTFGPEPKFLELMPHEVDLLIVVRPHASPS